MQSNAQKENLVRIPVTIDLMDGRKETVNLISPRALLKLYELVNREEQFLDVESLDGERFAIAKSAVKMIHNRDIPVVKDLNAAIAADDKNGFDPYAVLHVKKDDTAEAIHKAYLALVRDYHPDRFASVGLPKEINDYLTASIRRINVAYDMLQNSA